MKLSTRSRYGLRLMLALAGNYGKGNTFLKDIAREEEISEKYLSLIIIPLKGVGLVKFCEGIIRRLQASQSPIADNLEEYC